MHYAKSRCSCRNRHFRVLWSSKGGKPNVLRLTGRFATAEGAGALRHHSMPSAWHLWLITQVQEHVCNEHVFKLPYSRTGMFAPSYAATGSRAADQSVTSRCPAKRQGPGAQAKARQSCRTGLCRAPGAPAQQLFLATLVCNTPPGARLLAPVEAPCQLPGGGGAAGVLLSGGPGGSEVRRACPNTHCFLCLARCRLGSGSDSALTLFKLPGRRAQVTGWAHESEYEQCMGYLTEIQWLLLQAIALLQRAAAAVKVAWKHSGSDAEEEPVASMAGTHPWIQTLSSYLHWHIAGNCTCVIAWRFPAGEHHCQSDVKGGPIGVLYIILAALQAFTSMQWWSWLNISRGGPATPAFQQG